MIVETNLISVRHLNRSSTKDNLINATAKFYFVLYTKSFKYIIGLDEMYMVTGDLPMFQDICRKHVKLISTKNYEDQFLSQNVFEL